MADRYEEKAREIRERHFLAIAVANTKTGLRSAYDLAEQAIAATLRDQDAWHEIDDPEHPAPRDGSPFIGGVWLRADQRWHCTITAWMPWWNKDGCPFDIWSPVRLPPPPMSRREG